MKEQHKDTVVVTVMSKSGEIIASFELKQEIYQIYVKVAKENGISTADAIKAALVWKARQDLKNNQQWEASNERAS